MFRAVREKKPTLQLEEHIFYEIHRYNFLVDNIEKPLPDEWLSLSNLLGPEYNNPETLDDTNVSWPQDILILEDQNIFLTSSLNTGVITRHEIATGNSVKTSTVAKR